MSLKQIQELLAVSGGSLPTLILRPDRPSGPTIIVLGEIWAVNPQIRGLCERLAEEGFPVVAPDLYRGQDIPAPDATPAALSEAFVSFPDLRALRDCRTLVRPSSAANSDYHPNAPPSGELCMAADFAHYLGAFNTGVARVVNFYGRLNFPRSELKPFTPLDVASLMTLPYLGIFAEHDGFIPKTDVAALVGKLREAGIEHDVRMFEGVHHGFLNETREAYDASAASTAWEIALRFLRANQGGSAT